MSRFEDICQKVRGGGQIEGPYPAPKCVEKKTDDQNFYKTWSMGLPNLFQL